MYAIALARPVGMQVFGTRSKQGTSRFASPTYALVEDVGLRCAAQAYTRAAAADPGCAVYFSNRALCYLKARHCFGSHVSPRLFPQAAKFLDLTKRAYRQPIRIFT